MKGRSLTKKRAFDWDHWLSKTPPTTKTCRRPSPAFPPQGTNEDDAVVISHSSQSKNCFQGTNHFCEALAKRLNTQPHYLTNDGTSWYLHIRQWWPTSSRNDFDTEWDSHPTQPHALRLFGRTVYENRWSQSFGVSYTYSGSTNYAIPISPKFPHLRNDSEDEDDDNDDDDDDVTNHPRSNSRCSSRMVVQLIDKANELVRGLDPTPNNTCDAAAGAATALMIQEDPYNGCLMNWYEPDHTIGLHADDESSMRAQYPIFSLTWGGTRRFLLRKRNQKPPNHYGLTELWLHDGDLVVMGGTCQKTHRHEIPKRRKTLDPPTSNRINWTIRAFQQK